MTKTKLFFAVLFIAAALISCSKEGDFPNSGFDPDGISTKSLAGGGNITCETFGCSFEFSSGNIDYVDGINSGDFMDIHWIYDPVSGTVTWTSEKLVNIGFIVKGGPVSNSSFEGCGKCSYTGTVALPDNPNSGKRYGLSHIAICYNLCEQPTVVVAFKGYMTEYWSVTGGGPGWDYFIGYCPFVPGSYPLYLLGELSTPAGTLEVGNFDADPLLEVRVTSTIPGSYFINNAYLYVGTVEDFNIIFELYPYHIVPPPSSTVLTFDGITY